MQNLIQSQKAIRLYNSMCNQCKVKIMRHMKSDVQRDTPNIEDDSARMGMADYYKNKTLELLCPRCKRRYTEEMEK